MLELLGYLGVCGVYLSGQRTLLSKCLPILLLAGKVWSLREYKGAAAAAAAAEAAAAAAAAAAEKAKDDKKKADDKENKNKKEKEEEKEGGPQTDLRRHLCTKIAYGLLLSAAGDAALFLDDKSVGVGVDGSQAQGEGGKNAPSLYFIVGLFSFLLAHVTYIQVFYMVSGGIPMRVLHVLPFGLLFGLILDPLFPVITGTALYVPVIIYGIAIATMCYLAFHWYWHAQGDTVPAPGCTTNAQKSSRAFYGAILFMLSDSVLAWDKFVPFKLIDVLPAEVPLPAAITAAAGADSVTLAAHDVVMLTYYSAQLFIAGSME